MARLVAWRILGKLAAQSEWFENQLIDTIANSQLDINI